MSRFPSNPKQFDFRSDRARKAQSQSSHAKHLAEGVKRAAEMLLPKLPRGIGGALHGYTLTAEARENSAHLDRLIGVHKKSEERAPEPERKRLTGAHHRVKGSTI